MGRLLFLLALLPGVARAELGDEAVGLNTHMPEPGLLDMARDAGVTWIRVDGNWISMNPADGVFAWGEMDAVVDGARSRGLSVFMTLAYTPEWVPRVPRSRPADGPTNDEPAGSAEWVAFVEAAVARYRARGVTHYGLWNEPNLEGFWEGSADAYIDKILVPGEEALRRACGDCVHAGPDLAHVGSYETFLDPVLTRAMDRFDILAHHNYHGFTETGHTLFDGDSFLQALEMRRAAFTRISLREVLDAHGWTGEVWITETGYRAGVGVAADEERQAIYYRRVLEEQLRRPWWTNTFFYEISDCGVDIAGCDIDGYGIARPLRAHGGTPRSYPDEWRLKPAFDELQGFIREHPEIVMRAPPAACGDGRDNDGDGRADGEDRGCAGAMDADESDDPPRRRLDALPAGGIAVDGDLRDFGADGWLFLLDGDWEGTGPYGGPDDLSARAAARFQDGALYLGVEVVDDVHDNDAAADALYMGDSLQVAFDVGRLPGRGYDGDDHEITFALAGGAPSSHRFHGAPGASDGWQLAVVRDGTTTRYEVRLGEDALVPADLREGAILGFSFLLNDADGSGREGWIELTPGIGLVKDPYLFGEVALVTMPGPVDAGPPDGGDAGDGTSDAGAGGDGGPRLDGGSADDGGGPGGGGGRGCSVSDAGGMAVAIVFWMLLVRSRRRARRF